MSRTSRFILVRVPRTHSDPTLREALGRGRGELALYLSAGVVYVAIGVAFPAFLFSWPVALAYLLAWVVVAPRLVRLLR